MVINLMELPLAERLAHYTYINVEGSQRVLDAIENVLGIKIDSVSKVATEQNMLLIQGGHTVACEHGCTQNSVFFARSTADLFTLKDVAESGDDIEAFFKSHGMAEKSVVWENCQTWHLTSEERQQMENESHIRPDLIDETLTYAEVQADAYDGD